MSDKAIDVIGDGYDLVIRASAKLDESSLICKRIYSSRICTGSVARIHCKTRSPDPPNRAFFSSLFLLQQPKKNQNIWDYMDKAGNQTSVDVHQRIRSNNTEMSLALVCNGDGIIRLPEFYIEQQIKTEELILLFEDYVFPMVDVYALYPTRKHLASKVRCFLDLIDEMVVKH